MNRREEGTITVMVVGFVVVVALLAVVVVNASAAFLQRQELDNVADGAALAASDALSETSVYEEGLDKNAPLDPERPTRSSATTSPRPATTSRLGPSPLTVGRSTSTWCGRSTWRSGRPAGGRRPR